MAVTPLGRRKRSPSRIEHRERMRNEILDSAGQLINLGGVEHLTMRTLGKEVGVTAATLYGYFPAKEAVLKALLDEKMRAMNVALSQASEGVPPGARRILSYAIGYRQFALTSPDFYHMFIVKFDPPDWDLVATGEDEHSVVLTRLHREIQYAMDHGEMDRLPPVAVCRVLWSVAHGYVTLERSDCFDTKRLDPEVQSRRYLEHLLLSTKGMFTPQTHAELSLQIDTFAGVGAEESAAGDFDKVEVLNGNAD